MARIKHAKKRTKRLNPMSGAMIAIVLVMFMLLIVLAINGISLNGKISNNNARIDDLQEQISGEEQRTEDIEELQEYMKSDEYYEQTAKNKLGFVKDGEIIFKEK